MTEASVTWTEERLELLKKLWSEGRSASQIAAEMGGGMTRNAVLGKSHRLGLVRKAPAATGKPSRPPPSRPLVVPSTTKPAKQESPAPVISPARQLPTEPPKAAPAPPVAVSPIGEGLTIMELREGMCRWPLGDPTTPQFRYCGGHAAGGLPYCSHHAQLAYIPTVERKRQRA